MKKIWIILVLSFFVLGNAGCNSSNKVTFDKIEKIVAIETAFGTAEKEYELDDDEAEEFMNRYRDIQVYEQIDSSVRYRGALYGFRIYYEGDRIETIFIVSPCLIIDGKSHLVDEESCDKLDDMWSDVTGLF